MGHGIMYLNVWKNTQNHNVLSLENESNHSRSQITYSYTSFHISNQQKCYFRIQNSGYHPWIPPLYTSYNGLIRSTIPNLHYVGLFNTCRKPKQQPGLVLITCYFNCRIIFSASLCMQNLKTVPV